MCLSDDWGNFPVPIFPHQGIYIVMQSISKMITFKSKIKNDIVQVMFLFFYTLGMNYKQVGPTHLILDVLVGNSTIKQTLLLILASSKSTRQYFVWVWPSFLPTPPTMNSLQGGLVTDPQKTWNLFRNIFTNTLMTMVFGSVGQSQLRARTSLLHIEFSSRILRD